MEWEEGMSYLHTGYGPKIVKNPDEVSVCVFDGVNSSGVYIGFIDSLRLVTNELTWRTDEEAQEMTLVAFKELTLKEISAQVKRLYSEHATCIVMTYGPLSGRIYEYGNRGEYWEQIGVLSGYA